MVVTNELRIPEESPAVTSSGDGLDGPQTARMDRIVAKHQRELKIAREQVAHFLLKNGFASGSVNERKGTLWVTFPLHVSVKQNNAYITSKLLIFGADPMVKDIWGYTAYDCAKARPNSHQQIIKIFEKSGCSPSSPMWSSSNKFQSVPPPRGFEEFFAKLEEDPLVHVESTEAQWLKQLGSRRLRLWH